MKNLLSLSIGPVQDFIAAARKTADLKAGSDLLQASARTAANVLKDHGSLILPADPNSKAIPNKIFMELNEGEDPAQAAQLAQDAIRRQLKDAWTKFRKEIPDGLLDEELAQDQLENFLEFYAAWVPYEEGSKYQDARNEVEELLAARKNLREFRQPLSRAGRPKSPLDPSRDCVLKIRGAVPDACRKPPLMLKERETLDAVSLLKRIQGRHQSKNDPIPSTSLMAAKSILPLAREKAGAYLEELEGYAEKAGNGLDISDFLYPSRLEDDDTIALLKEAGINVEEVSKIGKALLKAVGKSECPPYYAILVADGDHMGEKLSHLPAPDEHRSFSQSMAHFAEQARTRIDHFDGYCVYAGGDDVLALLPVNQAIACANSLAQLFRETLKGGALSAGLAIVHHQESLQASIDRARDAEREAKIKRESLAVALHTRGGGPVIFSSKWDDPPTWEDLINAFRYELSHGFPYELRNLAMEWRGVSVNNETMQKEAKRILERKKGGIERKEEIFEDQSRPSQRKGDAAKALKEAFKEISNSEEMLRFADRLVIARFLANYPEVTNERPIV